MDPPGAFYSTRVVGQRDPLAGLAALLVWTLSSSDKND